jgi:UDP-N-acetylglucosamine 2-epimerase (non-hydrolysing)
MAPLIFEAKKRGHLPIVCLSGQHRDMISSFLDFFEIKPDFNLNVFHPHQSLSDLTSKVLLETTKVISTVEPDLVFVQGDTATTFGAALASFYAKKKIAHIEAGLRTQNIYSPFPEEANRKFVSQVAEFHFAPTKETELNLRNEGIKHQVYTTGNTSIDALKLSLEIIKTKHLDAQFEKQFSFLNSDRKLILITTHRRENHGTPLMNICDAILDLADKYSDIEFALPVHLNPNVETMIKQKLHNHPRIHLLPPLGYPEFVMFMKRSFLILTDSGGVQEEGPFFKKPIFVLRENTERPEAITSGSNILVGTNRERIFTEVVNLIENKEIYQKFAKTQNPYGDGNACPKIFDIIDSHFQK